MAWAENKLLDGFTEDELKNIAPYICVRKFEKEHVLVREGESGDTAYLLINGEVEVFKKDKRINTLGENDEIGFMAVIDKKPRSATVKAKREVTVAEVNLNGVKDNEPSMYKKLLANLVVSSQERLRFINNAYVGALEQKIKEEKNKLAYAQNFLTIILLFFIYSVFIRFNLSFFHQAITTTSSTVLLLLIIGPIGCMMIRKMPFALKFYGLSFDNAKQILWQSFVATTFFLLFFLIGKWFFIVYYPGFSDVSLFEFPVFYRLGGVLTSIVIVVYALFSIVQEVIIRALVQTPLHFFFKGRFATTKAVLLTTFLFGSMHIHFINITVPFVVLIPGLFWSMMFAKQRSVLGTSLSHIMVGVIGAMVIGFPGFR